MTLLINGKDIWNLSSTQRKDHVSLPWPGEVILTRACCANQARSPHVGDAILTRGGLVRPPQVSWGLVVSWSLLGPLGAS